MPLPLDKQNIINILGIQNLPDEKKLALLDKASDLVEQRVFLRVYDMLSDQERENWHSLMADGKEKEATDRLLQKVPNLPELLAEEIKKLKSEIGKLV